MKRAFLIGGLRKAQFLAHFLLGKGYSVTAVNLSYQDCLKLTEIDHLLVVNGDGTKPCILQQANVADADLAIALTPKDEDNLVICELCKRVFHVKNTAAIVHDQNQISFFTKTGIDSVICSDGAVTDRIIQQVAINDSATLIPVIDGRINLVKVNVLPDSPITGKRLWEISLPKEVMISCILRAEENFIPRGDARILAGDILLLIASADQEAEIIKILTGAALPSAKGGSV
ncbi:MAG: NAD-binding protein [Negativicutes bacterium]|nr:NAD-binding protein [Negativicutes bacterium]